MENHKVNKYIDNYLKLKYNITPLDNDEKVEILNSKETLVKHYTNEILEKVKENFFCTSKDTAKQIDFFDRQRNNLKLGKFYLGCVYRDFYFSLLGLGTSITCTIQEDENSKITSEILKNKMDVMKKEVDNSNNIIEIIDSLEKFRDEIF